MQFEPLAVSVDLVNDNIKFTGSLRDNPPITVDYTPPIGDGEGYTSLELFLISLATCVGSTVLLVLRKMRKTITGCQVRAHGVRREEHPTCFRTISVELTLNSLDVTESDVQNALRIAETSLCPVWAMIKNNVEVTASYQIISADGKEAGPSDSSTSDIPGVCV